MGTIKSALEFTDLPSDRNPTLTPAAKALRNLAETASFYGPNGICVPSDRAKRALDRRKRAVAEGVEVDTSSFEARPGALVLKQSPEVRAELRELTSDDVKDVVVDELMVGFYLENRGGAVWKIPGVSPTRC
jgi:hypothetical protein